ncbi:SAM-dependent methyltransferase [Streptomyces sp. NPDC051987]|uniref:SAM-dependent methyltransferase n=1 Tax=Streptomyces sp. NPDC051987 TaxID=3155808 RepID=UPI00342AED7D
MTDTPLLAQLGASRIPNGLTVLDTYCCSGGMAVGYWLAGFDVVGVDIDPQPNYPFTFIQGDAIEYIRAHGHEYDLIHGSPPCQAKSNLNAYNHKIYPELIHPTRDAMLTTGRPFVIENVEPALSDLRDPITLCGPMFDLIMYRHRLFETGGGLTLTAPEHPRHVKLCTRNGYLPTPEKPFMSIHGGKHSKAWQRAACDAMGMPWIKVPEDARGEQVRLGIREVCEAIPPAFARWIGERAAEHILSRRLPAAA